MSNHSTKPSSTLESWCLWSDYLVLDQEANLGTDKSAVKATAYFDNVRLDLLSTNSNVDDPYVLYEHFQLVEKG